jgi:riboflavin-specific deaminase-like protein
MHLLRQRALGDAVLIGHSTLEHDNVRLGLPYAELREARIARGQTPYPIRVIVSNEGKIDPGLNIFQTDISPVVIFSTLKMPARYQKQLRQKATLHLSDATTVDLAWMLEQLFSEYRVRFVACEGGATIFRALLEKDLVDQLNLTIAPYLFGGANAPTLTGLNKDFLPHSIKCSLVKMRTIGQECFLTYRIIHRRRLGKSQA